MFTSCPSGQSNKQKDYQWSAKTLIYAYMYMLYNDDILITYKLKLLLRTLIIAELLFRVLSPLFSSIFRVM